MFMIKYKFEGQLTTFTPCETIIATALTTGTQTVHMCRIIHIVQEFCVYL